MNGSRTRRGVALFVALGVMAVLVINAVTAEVTVTTTLNQLRNGRRELLRRVAADSLLVQAMTWSQAGSRTLPAGGRPDQAAEVSLRPLTEGDALWSKLPGMKPLAGDALVTIRRLQPPTITMRYLVNREGRRRGAVLLPRALESD
jgi:hypothetical protein